MLNHPVVIVPGSGGMCGASRLGVARTVTAETERSHHW